MNKCEKCKDKYMGAIYKLKNKKVCYECWIYGTHTKKQIEDIKKARRKAMLDL